MKRIYNHAKNLDGETEKQFEDCYKEEYVVAAALMPDAHLGYVAPIGSVLLTKGKIVPAWVGFDIGCGMTAFKLSLGSKDLDIIEKNKKKIHKKVESLVPLGKGGANKGKKVSKKTEKKFGELLEEFKEKEHDKTVLNFLETAGLKYLGTLGGGNHFIELCGDQKDLWIVIHSGSRRIGYKVAEKYMISASKSEKNFERTVPLDDSSDIGKEYLNSLNFCLEYALLNRIEIASRVLEGLESVLKVKIKAKLWVNKNHNHAILESGKYVHRKGATPAKKGERGVIPANMKDGSFLVIGKGNPKFLHSSSHGAGRKLSRREARAKLSLSEFEEDMKGIESNVSREIIDEAPQAYKDIFEVMELQKSSVSTYKHLKPIINWKGS